VIAPGTRVRCVTRGLTVPFGTLGTVEFGVSDTYAVAFDDDPDWLVPIYPTEIVEANER
jgi:hypothetical protein